MLALVLSVLLLSSFSQAYIPPDGNELLFLETFPTTNIEESGWVLSTKSNYKDQPVTISEYGGSGIFKDDLTLTLNEEFKFYGLSKPFPHPISNDGEFVFQYEVKLDEGLTCGGAYVKLLRAEDNSDLTQLDSNSPYTIMFGPDKCGGSSKVHFILQHQNPISKKWEEKHFTSPPVPKTDKSTHLYTLVIRKDNSFEIFIDQKSERKGNLLEDMDPPVNPPKYIDDPDDKKPADWVDESTIVDVNAKKPDDWDETAPEFIVDLDAVKPEGWLDDEPEMIHDPKAIKPDDWDDEEDGEFEAPLIPNPKCEEAPGCGVWSPPVKKNPEYKGKWKAPLIENPAYKGEWKPKKIENSAYFEVQDPFNFAPMKAVAIEVWTTVGGIRMDNFLIAKSLADAQKFASQTWKLKAEEEEVMKKVESKKKENEEREKKLSEGGIKNILEIYINDAAELISLYPLPSIISISVVLLTSLIFCFRKPKQHKKKASTVNNSNANNSDDNNDNSNDVKDDNNDTDDNNNANNDSNNESKQ